jgi:hypothetical protein
VVVLVLVLVLELELELGLIRRAPGDGDGGRGSWYVEVPVGRLGRAVAGTWRYRLEWGIRIRYGNK